MSEHTPGPWDVAGKEVIARTRPLKHSPDYTSRDVICGSPSFCLGLSDRDWPGNARLIAAAPELLEALEAIVKGEGAFSRDPLTHATNVIEEAQAIARAAIRKARGE